MADVARVTLQTIADEVGVSRMTVSNAFNKPDQLSAALRERILETAGQLGYVGPDPTARALVRGTAGAVGVLLTDDLAYAFRDHVATDFLGAVADELRPTGLSITLLSSTSREGVVPSRDVAIDGALVFSCQVDTATSVDWLRRRQLPLVMVDQVPDPAFSGVNIDDRGGARAAAEHIASLGHRRVGVLMSGGRPGMAGRLDAPTDGIDGWKAVARDRMLGFLDALEPAGAEVVVHHVADHDDASARREARALLESELRPTAVLCYSDVLAVGALGAAEDLGWEVPRRLSVVGFDDGPLATQVRPQLTTVHQDSRAKGTAAAEALTAAMHAARDGSPHEPAHVVLPTRLVVRDSSGPPPE